MLHTAEACQNYNYQEIRIKFSNIITALENLGGVKPTCNGVGTTPLPPPPVNKEFVSIGIPFQSYFM